MLMTLNLLVKDNHIVTHKDMAGDEVVSDNSKPPGFENFIKDNKACSWSSSTSRAGKCSTSFANYSKKDLKGFSFIDEMNQMIEVGVALSYDVKGCKKYLRQLINGIDHIERVILFGDLNEVRSESERFGSTFSYGDATIFNSFIHDTGLINLPMGGRSLLLIDYDFEDFVKEKWVANSDLEQSKPLHTKLKDLKSHLKLWYAHTKEVEANRKNCILATLRDMDKKIDDGHATDVDRTTRINKMQELEDLEKLELMDLVQKSRVKWEVEGDENSKFFRGLINSRRNSQIVQGIMLDGVWNSEAKDIKSAFLDFYKDNFSCHDSLVSFLPMLPLIVLALLIGIFSNPWSLLMKLRRRFGIVSFMVCFFSTGMFLQGSNSAFITLIPKVSNPLFIKDYRPISLIGIHYKIVAKILAKRLSKIINSIISLEQFAFMTWRQILDGPLILSETIDWYKKRKKKMMLFKVDFEKSFDFVSGGLHMALNDDVAANMFHGVKVGSPVGVSSNELEIIASYTGCEACFFPFPYLGLPIGSNMSRITNWQPLIDRFKARLSSWKANLLSWWPPYSHQICAHSEDSKNLAWVKWSNILASLDKGGLGVLKAFNIRAVNVGRTKAEFDALIFDIANLEPEELVDSDN
ncbi:RNA-directed DNA polymerase, eukaryota, reverse transcriptase zinc-binding domain protein [Tanacetum coccineum]